MGISDRLDRFQQRYPAAGFPLAVGYKYFDDSGGYLAALIAYYAFVSLFPLLLLLATVLGIVLVEHPALQQQVLGSALRQLPVIGEQLGNPHRLGGGWKGLLVGAVGSLYGSLGVAQALQYAMNTVWHVPRNNRPNPLLARARSLLLLCTAGLAVIGTTILSTLGSTGTGSFGPVLKVLALAASVVLNAAVFVLGFRLATARHLAVREVALGAVTAAVLWQLLQTFGVLYVSHAVRNASPTNGVFAVVLGLLAFLYLSAVVVVLCAEINVVLVDDLHPRSLLTPFTDNVSLTEGDRAAYTGQATAQRSKGFEDVDVSFDQPEASTDDEG